MHMPTSLLDRYFTEVQRSFFEFLSMVRLLLLLSFERNAAETPSDAEFQLGSAVKCISRSESSKTKSLSVVKAALNACVQFGSCTSPIPKEGESRDILHWHDFFYVTYRAVCRTATDHARQWSWSPHVRTFRRRLLWKFCDRCVISDSDDLISKWLFLAAS